MMPHWMAGALAACFPERPALTRTFVETAGGGEDHVFFGHGTCHKVGMAMAGCDGEGHTFQGSADRGFRSVEVAVSVEPDDTWLPVETGHRPEGARTVPGEDDREGTARDHRAYGVSRVVPGAFLQVLGADALHDGLVHIDLGDLDDGDSVTFRGWWEGDAIRRRRRLLDGLELLLQAVLVARLGDAGAPQLVGDEEKDEDAEDDEGAADPRHHSSDTHGRGGYGT